ncbi:MAG TPA: hypothetical protein VGV40_08360 [Solirubrobacteraceae bacterium]|nr:hypothetical protein [Solirubrobacteraceae bacterium]
MTRVLVVANRTAATPKLLDAVRERAQRGSATFYLVVPATPRGLHRVVDPEVSGREEAEANLLLALPLLSEAAGSDVDGHVGDADPLAAIHDAVHASAYDEIIVSTLPSRLSRWMRFDLPTRVRRLLGLPVTHVEGDARIHADADAAALTGRPDL